MYKFVLGLGAFMLVFSIVWVTASANGFEFLHKNSEAVRSFSNMLYCGGSENTFSISYGPSSPNPNNPNRSGGRSFSAQCKAPDGSKTDATNAKGLLDIGIFALLFLGSFAVMGWGMKMWINVPLPASATQENTQA